MEGVRSCGEASGEEGCGREGGERISEDRWEAGVTGTSSAVETPPQKCEKKVLPTT